MALLGLSRLVSRLRSIPTQVRTNLAQAELISALEIERTIKQSIQKGPKTGRLYRRGSIRRGSRRGRSGIGTFHQASAPGEPPATDTGRLVSSISIRRSDAGLTSSIGVQNVSSVKYARFLEFGTRRMKPRPFIRPAFALHKDGIRKRRRQAILAGLRARSG